MLPSLYMGDGQGVIDASVENTFSAQINGRAPVVAYQCGIFKNNASSDLVYDTGVVTLATPFYGADSFGDVVRFTFTIPSNSTSVTPHTTMQNGYIYGYKYILTLWWDLNTSDYSSGCVNSYETVFDAKATPTVSINSFSSQTSNGLPLVTSRSCTWTATYNQANNTGVQWFRWTLALASNHANIVDQTNKIDTNSAVQYTHDGLVSGTNYAINVEVQTQDGVLIESGWTSFTVSYVAGELNSVVEISLTSDNGIKLDWGSLKYIIGSPNNSDYRYLKPVPYIGHTCVELLDGNTITFTSSENFAIDIPINAEHVWSGYIEGDSTDIYYASGTDDSNASYYIKLSHAGSSHGLLPSATLYPSESLYPAPDDGGYFLLDINGASSYTVSTEDYYPSYHWFVVRMSESGMVVYAAPFDTQVIEDATVVTPS